MGARTTDRAPARDGTNQSLQEKFRNFFYLVKKQYFVFLAHVRANKTKLGTNVRVRENEHFRPHF